MRLDVGVSIRRSLAYISCDSIRLQLERMSHVSRPSILGIGTVCILTSCFG